MDDAVAKALHAARHHLAGGGFLSDLFSGPDYLSTGEVASPTNWGDPESAADFFKADRALRLAREASEPARDMPLPLRRPAPEAAPRQQVASPPPAPAPAARRIETLPGDTVEPHYFPPALERTISPYEFGQAVSGQQVTTQMLPHFQERPGFGQVLLNNKTNWADAQPEVPTSNPQKYTLPDAAFALPAPQAEISRAVSLAQNLAPQQEAIPNAADALAAVEKLHNAGVYSGEALDKAGEILAAHNRAKFDNIPVDDALRLSRAEGPRMVNQGMPVTGGTTRDNVPLAYAETPAPAPASQAISEAMPAGGKMTARIPDEPHGTALTKQQADYVIRTIAAETSGKSPEETQAIASVILNRINSGKYGASPEAVLFAKRQFEPWMNPAGANYPMKISPKSQRYSDARDALEAAMAGEDITRGATNFWGPKSQYSLGRDTPDWAIKMPDYTDIGATRFHRPNRAEGGEVEEYGDGGKILKKALDFLRTNPELKPYRGGSFSLERQGVYNPKYFDLKKDDLVDEAGNIIASKDVTIPREGFSYDLPAQADPNKIFRGMSAEEFANFQKNKYIQSLGTHNIGEGQKGLTYFSVNPDEARSYAHSFAPSEFKPDPSRPAYVVAAKRPPDESIARVPGTGESEVGVMGQIPREDVTNVYRGNVVDYIEGIHEPGARVSPNSSVHWEEINDYAHGGSVDDALRVVREHHADGKAVGPTMQQRLRETIASIDPERSQDQPVMDPATMGEAWNRARRNYQNFPAQEGEAVARPLELGARDVIGGAIGGEPRAPGADFRRGVADLLVGSTGLPNSGTLGIGALDATRALGIPLTLADMAHDIGQGDYANAAMNAALPAAFYARGPLGAAGRRAVEIAKEYAKPAAAAVTGVAGATVAPDEAEAGFVPKFITKGGSTTLQFPSGTPANTRLHGISGKGKLLLPQPLETYTAGFVPNKNLAPRTNVDWEKLEGGVAVPALWDRTIGGYTLESFGPHVLTNPKKLQGGTAYQRWGHLQPDQPAGASGSDVISRYIKRTQDAAKEGQPFLITSAMGNEGGDFSSMMYAPIIDVFRQNRGKIDNKLVAELDNGIRNKLFNDSKKIMGEDRARAYADKWPGMDNPDLDTMLAKMAGPYRSTMAKVMDKAKYRKGDMPDISALRFATTEPDLLHAPSLSTGYSVAKLDPRGIAIPSGHNDYDTAIRGLGYLGGAKTHIPWDMFWRDFAATRPAGENFAHTQKAFLTQMPLQKIDARLVDAIKKHEENAVRRGNPFGND